MVANEKQRGLKPQRNTMTIEIMDQIIAILSSTTHGNVTLVYQDSCLVQIERNEKIRPQDLISGNKRIVPGAKANCDFSVLRSRILEVLEKLEYGQVIIGIKDGRVVQIERMEKQRFAGLVGIYGDGI